MSPISIGPKFFACITGVYVLGEISISDGAVGGAFIQQDPIWIDDVSFWRIFFVFFVVSSSCSGCDPTRALNVYDGHFTVFCPIYWQWYHMTSTNGLPLFPRKCISDACIFNLKNVATLVGVCSWRYVTVFISQHNTS